MMNSASQQVLKEMEFEMAFYVSIAESEHFDIVPLVKEDGYLLTDEEYREIVKTSQETGIVILFTVDYPDRTLFVNPAINKTGILPIDSKIAFDS